MNTKTPLETVNAWQEAVNALDVERVLELSDTNVEIVGPRGTAYGHDLLREWITRAGLTLETLRTYERGEDVVLEQNGTWRHIDTKELVGEAVIATHFKVNGGRVDSIARYDDLNTALDRAGLSAADEIR